MPPNQPVDSPDNLFERVPADPGPRGRFTAKARPGTVWAALRLRMPHLARLSHE